MHSCQIDLVYRVFDRALKAISLTEVTDCTHVLPHLAMKKQAWKQSSFTQIN